MNKVAIEPSKIRFHPSSNFDHNGRVFHWNNSLFRGITARKEQLYNGLFDKGIIETLIRKRLLVETERTSYTMDGYPLVLKHRELPFVSYPFEWCAAMLKEAALQLLDLELELAKANLTLQDAHPWNILFDSTHPLNVDFGSIVPPFDLYSSWAAYDEFLRCFIYPLLLMSHGHNRIARWLLHDLNEGVLKSEAISLIGSLPDAFDLKPPVEPLTSRAKKLVPAALRSALKTALPRASTNSPQPQTPDSRAAFISSLKANVSLISIPDLPATHENTEANTAHVSIVERMLADLHLATVCDVYSENTTYSKLAVKSASTVISFHANEATVTRAYSEFSADGVSVLPLVMDFRNPSPGYGIRNKFALPAAERLSCDLVLALDCMEAFVFDYNLNFAPIAEGLATFAKKWVLIAFNPAEHRLKDEHRSQFFEWYNIENFIKALHRTFAHVEPITSGATPVYLCHVNPA
jgi:hypothetical protein